MWQELFPLVFYSLFLLALFVDKSYEFYNSFFLVTVKIVAYLLQGGGSLNKAILNIVKNYELQYGRQSVKTNNSHYLKTHNLTVT